MLLWFGETRDFVSLRRMAEGRTGARISYGRASRFLFTKTNCLCESLGNEYLSSIIESHKIIVRQLVSASLKAILSVSKPQSSECPIQFVSSRVLTRRECGISSRMLFLLIHKVAILPLHSRHPCRTGSLRFKYFFISIQPTWGNPSFFRKLLLFQLPLPLLDSVFCVLLRLLYMFLQCLA